MSGEFFVFDLAVWCDNSWGNNGWGNSSWGNNWGWGSNFYGLYGSNCWSSSDYWGSSKKQLWVSIGISSWSSKADSQDAGEDEYLEYENDLNSKKISILHLVNR